MSSVLLLILVALANALANVFMKVGANSLSLASSSSASGIFKMLTNGWIVLGAALLIGSFPLYNMVLQKMKLSVAYPLMTASAFALAAVISMVFMKERLALAQYVGLLLLPVSIWLLAQSR